MNVIYIPRYEQYLKFSNDMTVKAKPTNLNREACITCKNFDSNNCKLYPQTTIFDDVWTVCNFYKRKRSGAYRRKRAKYNKEGRTTK